MSPRFGEKLGDFAAVMGAYLTGIHPQITQITQKTSREPLAENLH